MFVAEPSLTFCVAACCNALGALVGRLDFVWTIVWYLKHHDRAACSFEHLRWNGPKFQPASFAYAMPAKENDVCLRFGCQLDNLLCWFSGSRMHADVDLPIVPTVKQRHRLVYELAKLCVQAINFPAVFLVLVTETADFDDAEQMYFCSRGSASGLERVLKNQWRHL